MTGAYILFLVGVALGISAAVAARRACVQGTWPTAEGTVVVSAVGFGRGFYPDVQYSFVHEGRRYHGLKVHSDGLTLLTPGRARKIVRRYPVGNSVKVFVDIRNPENSVLEPGREAHAWFMGLIGLAFMTVGALALLR